MLGLAVGLLAGTGLGVALLRGRPRSDAALAGLVTAFVVVAVAAGVVLGYLGPSVRTARLLAAALLVVGALATALPGRTRSLLARLLPEPGPAPGRTAYARGAGLAARPAVVLTAVGTAVVVTGAGGVGGREVLAVAGAAMVGAALPVLARLVRPRRTAPRAAGPVVAVVLLGLAAALVVSGAGAPGAPDAAVGDSSPAPLSRPTPGADQGRLAPLSSPLNQALDRCTPGAAALARCGQAPPLRGISHWFNTPGGRPVSLASLRGRVVLVDFWASSCINCRRHQPYLNAWYAAYHRAGLEVVGVQSPQLGFEARTGNVARAVEEQGIDHPVALDARLRTWTDYRNRYWPATYLLDAAGTVRSIRFGEGGEAQTEAQLRRLLRAADPGVRLPAPVTGRVRTLAPPGAGTSPETYLGWNRTRTYAGTPRRLVGDRQAGYTLLDAQPDDSYSLGGSWTVRSDVAVADTQAQVRLALDARRAYAVVAGRGTITVAEAGQPTRTVAVDGPDLYQLLGAPAQGRHVLTLQLSAGLRLSTLSFG